MSERSVWFTHFSRLARLKRSIFCLYSSFDHRCAFHPFVFMASFTCSLCFYNRDFRSFVKLFRHVGAFHRSNPSFQVTCNLSSSCGISYRTYAAYKAHAYIAITSIRYKQHRSIQLVLLHSKMMKFSSRRQTPSMTTTLRKSQTKKIVYSMTSCSLTTTRISKVLLPSPTSNAYMFAFWSNCAKSFCSRRQSYRWSRATLFVC